MTSTQNSSCDNYALATRLVKEFTNLSEEDRFLRAVKSVLNENDMPDDDQLLNAILELHMDDMRSVNADITHIHLVSIFQARNIFFQNINNVKGPDMVEVVKTRNRTLERVLSIIVFIHVLIKQETATEPPASALKEINNDEVKVKAADAKATDAKSADAKDADASASASAAVKTVVNTQIQDTVADISTVETVLTCVLIGVAIGLFIVCVF